MQCPKCKADVSQDSHFCSKCGAPVKETADLSVSQTKTIQKPAISSGKTIAGKYKIIEEIGRGGMGLVYKAKDIKLKRTVALKFLPPELTQDSEAKQRFIQEAQAAAALNDPHICTIHEVDEDEGQIFIAMEYIQGLSLKQRLEEGPLVIDEAKDLALQVAEGLKEAHDKGIVHRDIKPANIMLTEKGQAKITDFGLAKLTCGADLTKASTIMGTVAYMSPEQAKGEEVDHRTDIWSLGAMLYEMLTGERPFKKSHEQALIYEILNEEPPSIKKYRPDVPVSLEQVILRSLKKSTGDRYKDIRELMLDLKSSRSVTLPKLKNSIAVLPFTDLSPGTDQEYFCDGVAEELINALTQVGELKVTSRTSSFQFKGKGFDIREIGTKLEVAAVLEGSVRKAGNRVRITAQLIDITDGYHVWSEKFDRDLDDIFSIQDEISLAIVEKLKIKLLGVEKVRLTKRHTENREAYNLYLKGRFFWNKRFEGGLLQAMDCFRQAIDMDPLFALAYAAMADCHCLLGFLGYAPPHDIYPKGKAAAYKALEIDDELGEAHASLGWIKTFYDWDWPGAEGEFQKALKLCPHYATAPSWYGWLLCAVGRFDEAVAESEKAVRLDPISLIINANLGLFLGYNGQYDEAVEQCQKTIKMDPNFATGHVNFGLVYSFMAARVDKNSWGSAIASFHNGLNIAKEMTYAEGFLGMAYGLSGQGKKAEEVLRHLEELSQERFVSPLDISLVHLGMNDMGKTFEYLEKALEIQASMLVFLKYWPPIENVRSDPRGQAILKRIGLE
ncbi:MAG: protein kinase [Candidatus Aminicenantaceae bacterium]